MRRVKLRLEITEPHPRLLWPGVDRPQLICRDYAALILGNSVGDLELGTRYEITFTVRKLRKRRR